MKKLGEVIQKLNSKGYRVKVDEETLNSCFYIADRGQEYQIEFWADNKDDVSKFECFHKDVPSYKETYDLLDNAISFCENMDKRLKLIKEAWGKE